MQTKDFFPVKKQIVHHKKDILYKLLIFFFTLQTKILHHCEDTTHKK